MLLCLIFEQKQIQTLNKLCSSLLEKLNNPREERDAESICTSHSASSSTFSTHSEMLVCLSCCVPFLALRQNKQYFNPTDTNTLVGAVAFGKGLSKCRPAGPVAPGHPGPGTMMSGASALQQAAIGGGSVQQAGSVGPQQQGQQGRSLKMSRHASTPACSRFPVRELLLEVTRQFSRLAETGGPRPRAGESSVLTGQKPKQQLCLLGLSS